MNKDWNKYKDHAFGTDVPLVLGIQQFLNLHEFFLPPLSARVGAGFL